MVQSTELFNSNFSTSRRFIPGASGHNGIDWRSPTGTPVKARFSGIVKITGTNPPKTNFGDYIKIFHPQLNISSWYAHLLSFKVVPGQVVSAGQIIALSDNTGLSTGPHLHYGESRGETQQWIDPDLTKGGNDMVTEEILLGLYNGILMRNYPDIATFKMADPAAFANVGKPFLEVLRNLLNSPERDGVNKRYFGNASPLTAGERAVLSDLVRKITG